MIGWSRKSGSELGPFLSWNSFTFDKTSWNTPLVSFFLSNL
jgi:hypothetical protein